MLLFQVFNSSKKLGNMFSELNPDSNQDLAYDQLIRGETDEEYIFMSRELSDLYSEECDTAQMKFKRYEEISGL
jgi:hypothetical protein